MILNSRMQASCYRAKNTWGCSGRETGSATGGSRGKAFAQQIWSPDFCAQKQASLSDETGKTKMYTISEKMGNTVRMQNTLSGCWGHLQIPTGHLSDLGRQPAGKVLDSPTWVPTQKPDGYGAAIESQCTEDRITDSPKQARAVRKKTASSSRALPQSIR